MTVIFIDPATKEKLVLTEFKVDIDNAFGFALGKDPGARGYRCDEDSQRLWPIKCALTASGIIEVAKEGRLRVTVGANYTIYKNLAIQHKDGYGISLRREATGQDLGGHLLHDRVAAMVRAKEEALLPPLLASLRAAIVGIRDAETLASSAHAARARVASTVHTTLKKTTLAQLYGAGQALKLA